MKHLNFLLCITAFFTVTLISCKEENILPEPVAAFTMSEKTVEPGEIITFTNRSENATSYFWDFGDGETSTDENPTHSYSVYGTFTITLTATGEGGEDLASKTITVSYPAPVANFTMDKTEAETGKTITFTNSSENATGYSWDFGDGNTSTDENPTHSYSSDGTFTVKLTATGDGGINSTSKTISIINPLIGKWDIIEGTYNGSTISDLTGYINIVNETHYKASFDNSSNSGYVSAKYTLTGTTFKSNLNGNSLILNGYSSSYTLNPYEVIWSASLSCSRTVFNKWGGTAIAYGENSIEISGTTLIFTSRNGKTIIKYTKE